MPTMRPRPGLRKTPRPSSPGLPASPRSTASLPRMPLSKNSGSEADESAAKTECADPDGGSAERDLLCGWPCRFPPCATSEIIGEALRALRQCLYGKPPLRAGAGLQIGKASCGDRVCQYV